MSRVSKWLYCILAGTLIGLLFTVPLTFIYYASGFDWIMWGSYTLLILSCIGVAVLALTIEVEVEKYLLSDNKPDEEVELPIVFKQSILSIYERGTDRLISKINLGSSIEEPGGDDKTLTFFNFHEAPENNKVLRLMFSNTPKVHPEEMTNSELVAFGSYCVIRFSSAKGFEAKLPMSTENAVRFHTSHGWNDRLSSLSDETLKYFLKNLTEDENFDRLERRPVFLLVDINKDALEAVEIKEDGSHVREWEELFDVQLGNVLHTERGNSHRLCMHDLHKFVYCRIQIIDKPSKLVAKKKYEYTVVV